MQTGCRRFERMTFVQFVIVGRVYDHQLSAEGPSLETSLDNNCTFENGKVSFALRCAFTTWVDKLTTLVVNARDTGQLYIIIYLKYPRLGLANSELWVCHIKFVIWAEQIWIFHIHNTKMTLKSQYEKHCLTRLRHVNMTTRTILTRWRHVMTNVKVKKWKQHTNKMRRTTRTFLTKNVKK